MRDTALTILSNNLSSRRLLCVGMEVRQVGHSFLQKRCPHSGEIRDSEMMPRHIAQ
jgi:hypothetical protein